MTDPDPNGAPGVAPDDAARTSTPPHRPVPAWRRALPHLGVFALAFIILQVAVSSPRVLTADEADTLRGGRLLVDVMTAPEHDLRFVTGASLRVRVRAGFQTTDNPRLATLPDSAPRRAALEAPLPRWLAALGIGVLPVSVDATNLQRASVASSLALALSLALLSWMFRRRGGLFVGFVLVGALGTNGFIDAGASAGYGAASVLAMTLFIVALERLVATGRGAIWVGAALGLCLGVHPLGLVLVASVFIAWAVRRPGSQRAEVSGQVALPSAPVMLFAVPLIAILTLVVIWPTLWNDTGNRLGAWLLDFGSTKSMPHEVAGLAFDQAAGRAGQAWTAIFQWIAWTPLPILALWGVGLARAITAGRDGLWTPLVALFSLLFAGALDGGLFGARLSLLALLWIPTLITAADGAVYAITFLVRRAERITRWPRLITGARLTWLVAVLLLVGPVLQAARGTTLGIARSSGAELRFGVPLSLLDRAAELMPGASIYASPHPAWFRPALEAAREDLEADLSWSDIEGAELAIVIGTPIPWLALRLEEELARDPRPGTVTSLWRLKPTAPPN